MSIDFVYALYCQQTNARLGAPGVYTSYPMPTYLGLTADEKNRLEAERDGIGLSGTSGKDSRHVEKIEIPSESKWYLDSLFSLNFSSSRAPIRMSILRPEKITLKNEKKPEKEIVIMFHEPYAEERPLILKRHNFRQASLMVNQREADFTASVQATLLKGIQKQIINQVVKQSDLNPPDSRIKVVFSGEGLAGLDAQLGLFYFLKDLADDVDRPDNEKKYADLKNRQLDIELSLIDACYPKTIAEQVLPLLEKVKKNYSKTRIKSKSFDMGQAVGKLGGEHIFYRVSDPELVHIHHETRKQDGTLVKMENNSNASKIDPLKKSTFTNFLYRRASVRLLHFTVTGIRNFFVGLLMPKRANQDLLKEILDKREGDLINEIKETNIVEPLHQSKPNLEIEIASLELHERDHYEFGRLVGDLDETNRFQMFKGMPPIENLVFEGGGVKGLVYAGALKRMHEANLDKDVKRVAGSSAGAIVSALLAVGYTPEAIEQKMKEIDFSKLMDRGEQAVWESLIGGQKIADAFRLYNQHGIYKGDVFLNLISEMLTQEINKKLSSIPDAQLDDVENLTFGQLAALREKYPDLGFKALFVTGTKLSTGELVVFSHETHPNLAIKSAVRASMSFPGAFVPYSIDGEAYADGGIANNWPMGIFDDQKYMSSQSFTEKGANPSTLGFLVDTQDEIENRWFGSDPGKIKQNSLLGFAGKIIQGLHSRSEDLKDKYHTQAIQIFDEQVETLDFHMSDVTKTKLIDSGYREMDGYVQNYRQSNVKYDALFFKSFEEKYAIGGARKLSVEQINLILNTEIEPYLNRLEEFKCKYTEQLVVYNKTLSILSKNKEELKEKGINKQHLSLIKKQIEHLKSEIGICESALDIIDNKKQMLNTEKQYAEKALLEIMRESKTGNLAELRFKQLDIGGAKKVEQASPEGKSKPANRS